MYTLNWPPGLSSSIFLQEYWQKKPLIIRQAIPDFSSPITPQELAGLACEEGIEARLILEKDGKHPWELRNGPFQDSDFQSLPSSHWTLLVQDVEKHLPDLVPIVDLFQFIPYWRIDDLMISYAPVQGSVGPHTDAYDVFLLQGYGERHWHIAEPGRNSALVPNIDLRILEQFTSAQNWVLQPGDILYLPPGIPHYGVALNDCMTYSIGFRAPSIQGLAESFMEHAVQNISPEILYSDPDLKEQENPHEITADSIRRIYERILQTIQLPESQLPKWLGEILSESKSGFSAQSPEPLLDTEVFLRTWEEVDTLYRNTALRFLFTTQPTDIHFYVDSERTPAHKDLQELAEWLCASLEIHWSEVNQHPQREKLLDTLYTFYCKGYYYFDVE